MILRGYVATRFGITLLGYQVPEGCADHFERNWLRVHVQVQTIEAQWEGTGACLLTWEVAGLVRWLRTAAESKLPIEDPLRFTGPELVFAVFATDDENVFLRVATRYALSGTTAGVLGLDENPRHVDLALRRNMLRMCADELKNEAAVFPER